MTKKIKCFFKSKYYGMIDFTALFIIKLWLRSIEGRIDYERFDPVLSRKIDAAHHINDLWSATR